MGTRTNAVDEAGRRAVRQLDEVVTDLRAARLAAGLSQAVVARAVGCSRPLVTRFERRAIDPTPLVLARWGAVVGLDVSLRTFLGGSPLRDAGQLRLLARFREHAGNAWTWRTEVPVTTDPRDRRAIDAVLSRGPERIGSEAIVRLTDAQTQTRNALAKQQAAGLGCMILVLADTRNNRLAVRDGEPTLRPAFPLGQRDTLRALRAGEVPNANGIVLI